MQMKKIAMTMFLVAALGLIATTAIGHRGGAGGCGNCPKQFSGIDNAAADIQGKYADSYAALDKKMATKREQIRAARLNDATTMGEFNTLREEMFQLKKEYWQLEEKVRQELGSDFGGYGGGYYCDGPGHGYRGPKGPRWGHGGGMHHRPYNQGCRNCPNH